MGNREARVGAIRWRQFPWPKEESQALCIPTRGNDWIPHRFCEDLAAPASERIGQMSWRAKRTIKQEIES